MSQQDVIDYVMNTPHNTNPVILKQKIKEISGEVILYTQQELTEEQKAQARENIGAIPTPATAQIGQFLSVKSVDANNRPIEWEATTPQVATEEDAMDLLTELGTVEPITTLDGAILTSSTGEIYSL